MEEKKQKASLSSTVKSFRTLIKNLEETGLINEEDMLTIKIVYENASKEWIKRVTEI